MSIEDIIHAWKTEEGVLGAYLPASPVGKELSDDDLLAITGGNADCTVTCTDTQNCNSTCEITCRTATEKGFNQV